MEPLILIVLLFGAMWLLLIRPQRRRQAAQSQMLSDLAVGDEIVTAGGLYGHIRSVDDEEVRLEVAPGTTVRVAKRAVAVVVPPEDRYEQEEEDEDLAAELEADAEPRRDPEAAGEQR